MSDTTKEPTYDEVLSHLEGLDSSGVEIPADPTAPGATALAKEPTETEEPEKSQSSDEDESPETGTESEDTEETEEQSDEPKAKEDEAPKQTDEPKAEEKPLSKEEKAKAREAKAWQKLEAEKAEVAKARAEIESAKAEIALSKARKPEPIKDEKGFTADEYDSFVKDAERENKEAIARGDDPKWSPANIEVARVKAEGLRQREHFEGQQQRVVAKQAAVQQAIDKYPDLKQPESAMTKEMLKVWESNKDFWGDRPDAVAVMAELAASRVKADSVPVLEKKVTELTKELDRLNKLASPSKGSNLSMRGSKKESPSWEDVQAAAEALDNAGVSVG